MTSSWRSEKGHLACRWSGAAEDEGGGYRPQWMQGSDIRGSYLPPLPDFAGHSPFGGPSWFGLDVHDPARRLASK